MKANLATALVGLALFGPLQGEAGDGKVLGRIGNREVHMVPTGAAVRTNGIIKVYNIKSYIEKGHKVASAAELAAADCPKQLHLDMLFPLDGPEMADAFTRIIRLNYPSPAFADEVQTLADTMRSHAVRRGDQVWLTHIPKVGLHYRLVGTAEKLIRNVEFSKAVWNNFLGENNVGDAVKKGLVSELDRRKSSARKGPTEKDHEQD